MTLPALIPATSTTIETATGAFMLAVETLKELPTKRKALVALLTDIGVRGVPYSGTHCVLAEYLRGVVWPGEGINLRMLAGALHMEFEDIELIYNLSEYLTAFAFEFDCGDYPALIR